MTPTARKALRANGSKSEFFAAQFANMDDAETVEP